MAIAGTISMRRLMVALALAAASAPGVLAAQEPAVGARVERLESQMRAVQRKVFPGGDGRFFEPQVAASTPTPSTTGTPSESPVTDLTERVTALESQLRTLTGQAEQNGFKLRQLEEAMTQYRADIDRRLAAIEGGGEVAGSTGPAPSTTRPATTTAATRPSAARPAALSASRQAALDAIEMPATGDAGEDAYTYGFRLWEGQFYPQAQAQLKKMVADHPRHRRVTFARNLIGRAYLDEGKPALAGKAFYENYEKQPRGERAPDSLYYFGMSLIRLDQRENACAAFAEFTTQYGATASASLKAQVEKARGEARCG